jgi:Ca-activated chloride channel family protein
MKSRLWLFIVCAVLMLGVFPTFAQTDIIVPPRGVFTDPEWLKIDYQRIAVSIDNQIATTNIDMQFTNEGPGLAEGTFLFPLPQGATVSELVMYINGVAIEARVLPADDARAVYNEIVRQYLDPALLEYIGTSAIQANVFPIPPSESRRIEISYTQVLEVDNGLIHYIFPMNTNTITPRPIEQMSISVDVVSNDIISNIYSPSHRVAVVRGEDDKTFRASWEANGVLSGGDDFSLYYAVANDTISVNLLTYRESANEDGFFMLLMQPPLSTPADQVLPKDVIIVLDQSGSMDGVKWQQATQATSYVLDNLNPQDRFNVVVFSSGVRVYGDKLQAVSDAPDASAWVNGLFPEGGTNIELALSTALSLVETDRATTILFLTDGLATEGITFTDDILASLSAQSRANTRIFTFGVGDDVDTLLLDSIARDFRGTTGYVRPSERVDEEVASLYTKISAPVLTDVTLDFGNARVELLYPATLSDLFAGEQITLVGRYRDGMDNLTLRLNGLVGGAQTQYVYEGLNLRQNAGGEPFIARLWATRRIGELLNTIRLNGENPELVQSIVSLSVRYGIITPYTSFLIDESDILTQGGMDRAEAELGEAAMDFSTNNTGARAVDDADMMNNMNMAEAPAPMIAMPTQQLGGAGNQIGNTQPVDGFVPNQNAITAVAGKTFINLSGIWNDTTFQPDTMETVKVEFLSDAYFDLLADMPELAAYFALGQAVIVVIEGVAYEVVPMEA